MSENGPELLLSFPAVSETVEDDPDPVVFPKVSISASNVPSSTLIVTSLTVTSRRPVLFPRASFNASQRVSDTSTLEISATSSPMTLARIPLTFSDRIRVLSMPSAWISITEYRVLGRKLWMRERTLFIPNVASLN